MTTDQPDQPDGGGPEAPEQATPSTTPPPQTPAAGPGDPGDDSDIPLGQRLFDSPFLLLFACMLVMFVFFTGWGMLEIMSLEPATLP